MRIGSSLIIHRGLACQSYNWSIFRPLGSVQRVVDALDEYQCDEISIILPLRGGKTLSSVHGDLSIIKDVISSSPMSLGGGIRSIDDINYLAGLPVERFMISSAAVSKNWKLIERLKYNFGSQAVQCVLPVKFDQENVYAYNCSESEFISINNLDLETIAEMANEVIVYDTQADGLNDHFNFNLLSKLRLPTAKTIITGGVGSKCIQTAREIGIAACIVDNRTLHTENSIIVSRQHARLS